jgi:hypothetical protein
MREMEMAKITDSLEDAKVARRKPLEGKNFKEGVKNKRQETGNP